jgi:hypothetical protein
MRLVHSIDPFAKEMDRLGPPPRGVEIEPAPPPSFKLRAVPKNDIVTEDSAAQQFAELYGGRPAQVLPRHRGLVRVERRRLAPKPYRDRLSVGPGACSQPVANRVCEGPLCH